MGGLCSEDGGRGSVRTPPRGSVMALACVVAASCSVADPGSCTDAEVLPVMVGNFPGGPVGLGEAFMWRRGKGGFRVEDGCRFTRWYGDTFEDVELDTAVSKPRAGILSDDAWKEMSVALEVSTWRDLSASDLDGGNPALHQGVVVFSSGDHQLSCSACNVRGERLRGAAYDMLEELIALGEPVDGEGATLATVEDSANLLSLEDRLWSFEWAFEETPEEVQLHYEAGVEAAGLALQGPDLQMAFAMRDQYLARDMDVYSKTQNRIATVVGDVAYEVWIRDEWPSWSEP